MSKATKSCSNPLCHCSPCRCGDDCRCGSARLGDLEQQVMDVLWDENASEMNAREVNDFLEEYALTTISTVLDRLSHKGLVFRRNRGHSVWFSPACTRAQHTVLLMRQVLATTNAPEDALFEFVRQASHGEVQILRKAINNGRR